MTPPCPIERYLNQPVPDWAPLVQAASPMLFALARRHDVRDPEEFAFQVLRRALAERRCWSRSGLPGRVWLCGLALQAARSASPPHLSGTAAS